MLAQTRIRDDLDAWNSALGSACGNFRARVNPRLPIFIGDLDYQKDEHLEVATIRTNAGQITHRRNNADCQDDRYCFLVMQRSGRMQMLSQGKRAFELRPGEMMLMDSISPCEMMISGLVDHASIHLERREVQRRLPPGQRLFGKIPTGNVSGQILYGMVKQLLNTQQALSLAEGQTMQDVIVLLLAQALQVDANPNAICADLGSGHLQRAARQLIEQQLDDALLSPPTLAQQLGISLRQLYRLFDEDGGVSRYIQQRRLLRSAEDLRSAHLGHESITQIAYRCGFTDSAHFSRAFKKHFACTPSEYRACQH